jgi:hypothetical protein
MKDSAPNLFNALFQFHPRDGHTPKENFLSEAFAHVLATCGPACDTWLSLALRRPVHAAQCQVTTRQAEYDEDASSVIPDMRLKGVLKDGEPFDLSSEHKWDSPCNPGQLKTYLKLVAKRSDRHLAFVGSSHRQKRDALSCDPRMKGRAFLWADVFEALDLLPNKPDILTQFLGFMKTHGLSPGEPIQTAAMVGFIKSTGFLASLGHTIHKLNDDFDWEFFPKRYCGDKQRDVTSRWGRIAIEFATPAWKPAITVGFLFDEWDHGVSFVNPQRGVDLLLRIEAAPDDQKNIAPAMAELARKRGILSTQAASVLLLGERGNDNEHSLLIVRSCLGDLIEKTTTQQEQLETIHRTFKTWGESLFSDGMLEGAFKKAGLDSGL